MSPPKALISVSRVATTREPSRTASRNAANTSDGGAIESLGPVAFTPYAKSGTTELADICSHAFAGNVDTIVMERHGLSSVGATLERAFTLTDLAEQTAHIEYVARTLRCPSTSSG